MVDIASNVKWHQVLIFNLKVGKQDLLQLVQALV